MDLLDLLLAVLILIVAWFYLPAIVALIVTVFVILFFVGRGRFR